MKITFEKHEVNNVLNKMIPKNMYEGFEINDIEIDYGGRMEIKLFPVEEKKEGE